MICEWFLHTWVPSSCLGPHFREALLLVSAPHGEAELREHAVPSGAWDRVGDRLASDRAAAMVVIFGFHRRHVLGVDAAEVDLLEAEGTQEFDGRGVGFVELAFDGLEVLTLD